MSKKRGQITVFIIIGVVILLSAVIILFIQNMLAEDQDVTTVTEAPMEARPIASYIENCLATVSKDGLYELGQRGGYIYPERWGIEADPVDVLEGSAVTLTPGSEDSIPYWYHLEGNDCNRGYCPLQVQVPTVKRSSGNELDRSVESQLDHYVEENLRECVSGFDVFPSYQVEETGELNVTTTVLVDEVMFYLDWPLEITNPASGNIYSLKENVVTLPLDFNNIYQNALAITAAEMDKAYLERMVINMISAFSGKSRDKLPPTTASSFEPTNDVYWLKSDVETSITGMVTSYVPAMQYYNSKNYKKINTNDPFVDFSYNKVALIPSTVGAEQLEVTFDFLPEFWDLYFDINCDGEICSPESVSVFDVISIGLQRYRFYYDVSFPVLVTVRDPDALDEGYTLQFFLEANIRDNKPVAENMTAPLEMMATAEENSMLCDPDKRNTGPAEFSVSDGYTGEPVDEANIVYTIGGESCIVGETEEGSLNTSLPVGFGGFISFVHEDYETYTEPLNTNLDESYNITAELYTPKEFNISVMKKEFVKTNQGWEFKDNALHLLDTEYAMVSIERVDGVVDDFQSLGLYYGNESESETIKVMPGKYSIDIYHYRDEPFIIPEYKECYDTGWFGEEECTTIPRMVMNTTVLSQMEFNHSFTAEDIMNSSEIIFYTASPALYSVPENERKADILEALSTNQTLIRSLPVQPKMRGGP